MSESDGKMRNKKTSNLKAITNRNRRRISLLRSSKKKLKHITNFSKNSHHLLTSHEICQKILKTHFLQYLSDFSFSLLFHQYKKKQHDEMRTRIQQKNLLRKPVLLRAELFRHTKALFSFWCNFFQVFFRSPHNISNFFVKKT